jgi:hypothetical protein
VRHASFRGSASGAVTRQSFRRPSTPGGTPGTRTAAGQGSASHDGRAHRARPSGRAQPEPAGRTAQRHRRYLARRTGGIPGNRRKKPCRASPATHSADHSTTTRIDTITNSYIPVICDHSSATAPAAGRARPGRRCGRRRCSRCLARAAGNPAAGDGPRLCRLSQRWETPRAYRHSQHIRTTCQRPYRPGGVTPGPSRSCSAIVQRTVSFVECPSQWLRQVPEAPGRPGGATVPPRRSGRHAAPAGRDLRQELPSLISRNSTLDGDRATGPA